MANRVVLLCVGTLTRFFTNRSGPTNIVTGGSRGDDIVWNFLAFGVSCPEWLASKRLTQGDACVSTSGGDSDGRKEFELLARAHADMLEAYLRTLLRPGSSLDDLFQESMIVAWRKFSSFDRSRGFDTWLRGIARVCLLEQARKQRAQPTTTDPDVLNAIDQRFEVLSRDADGGSFVQRVERLVLCMGRLPEAMREAVDLVCAREIPIVAAARSLDLSEETLKKRVQRGRQLLAECIGLSDPAGGAR